MTPSDFEKILNATRSSDFITSTNYSLWCSKELLVEEISGTYFNNCKKYELSKIQAFTYYVTNSNHIVKIICGLFAALFLVLLLVFITEIGAIICFGILLIPFSIIFIKKTVEGDSCKFYLVSAVGVHLLESVKTVKRAKILLSKVNNYIANVQGNNDEAALLEKIEELSLLVTRKPRLIKKGAKK